MSSIAIRAMADQYGQVRRALQFISGHFGEEFRVVEDAHFTGDKVYVHERSEYWFGISMTTKELGTHRVFAHVFDDRSVLEGGSLCPLHGIELSMSLDEIMEGDFGSALPTADKKEAE